MSRRFVLLFALSCLTLLSAQSQPFALSRALDLMPELGPAEAKLNDVFSQGETLPTPLKLAMGYQIAKELGNSYWVDRLSRQAAAFPESKRLLSGIEKGPAKDASAERVAIEYARALTSSVHGVDSALFAQARRYYNDSQVVELTMTTAYYNYAVRLAQGFGVVSPSADWLPTPAPAAASEGMMDARISLASNEEVAFAAAAAGRQPAPQPGVTPDFGMANSQRAMMRAPRHARAWGDHWAAFRKYQAASQQLKLQVSFAVSMANGCRYCTLHQVRGLRRQGVDVAKLVAMQKDDSALTPQELAAVVYARKLTKSPKSVTDSDFQALATALGKPAATEIVMQTAIFNFMNRFTDGLRLPSEDDAVKTYLEVYGKDFPRHHDIR